ncbi:carboxypeptidase-like regulatory domain-containing protein [Sphingomonas aerolata]|uniref:carboxypeptidase-like regulatory domain-containing protein n=1 Tax=Sphingomonas aerolata TaxID=185951 RepID=UPI002FE12ECD
MTKMMLRAAALSLTALSGGVLFAPAPAAAQVGQASLRGTITAPADNPVVEVTAVEVATGLRRTVPADAAGGYNFASLRAGTYRLEIKQRTGTRNSDSFTLRVGQSAGLDLDLSSAATPPPLSRQRPVPNLIRRRTPGRPRLPAARATRSSSLATGSARCRAARSAATSRSA